MTSAIHRSKPASRLWKPTRRSLLAMGGAAICAPYLGSTSLRAQGKELVVPMSGGSFMTIWGSEVADTFKKKTGISVKMVPGNMKTHAMSSLAAKGNPPFDLAFGNGDDFIQLLDAGKLLPLSPDKVPNIDDIHVKFKEQWQGHGSMFDYFSIGLAYATDQVKNPPASWKEFVERTVKGDFGANVFFNGLNAGVRGPEVLVNLARALSGSEQNVDAAFDALKRMKPNVFKFFGSINDPILMLLNGEGIIGPSWDGRTFVAQDESNGKVAFVKPSDGLASNGPAIGVIKGGNEDAAYQLVNHALSVEVQKPFCEKMFYGAVNTKVSYSGSLAQRIPKPDEVNVPSERFMATNMGAWIKRWNQEIAS